MSLPYLPDPDLDLAFERVVSAPVEAIWRAWTTPDLILRWFTPAPWSTVGCELDLRPGGRFHVVMRSPEGEDFPMTGCYLEVVPRQRIVWTSALGPGFRPALPEAHGPTITAVISLEAVEGGTRYRALALHRDAAARKAHEAMGFREGWGRALDQLLEAVQGM